MAPKKRASSPGPKAKAKAEPKAKGKAKAEPKVELVPKFGITAEALFDKYATEVEVEGSEEKEKVIKVAGFAQCIKDANDKWDSVFDDDPPIKEQWRHGIKGFTTRQVTREQFLEWLPSFIALCDSQAEAKKQKEENEEKARKEKEEQAAKDKLERKAMYAGDGIWSINLVALKEAMDAAFQKGKTPLILDSTEGHRAEVFLTYSGAYVIECKKMIMDKAKGGVVENILEEERERFFRAHCFKHGQTVVFRFANTAIDINKVFCSESFPSKDLLNAEEVAKVLGIEAGDAFVSSPFYKMCKTSDEKSDCVLGVNEKFRVIAISHFEDADYEGYLKDSVPLNQMQPIRVNVD